MYDASRTRELARCLPDLDAPVQFRRLTPRDAQEVAYLELEIFHYPWSEKSLRDCLELATVEGEAAVVNGHIAGYLMVQCVYEEAHILNLAVHHSYRRLGVARRLLERFLKQATAKAITEFFLEVRVSNYVAQRLYFSMGFAPLSVRKAYYPDGEDALVLVKRL